MTSSDLHRRFRECPASPAVRAELAREGVRVLGIDEAARLTDGWGLPPRPGFLQHAEHGSLPGVVRCLADDGTPGSGTSGLSILAWLVGGHPDALRVVAKGERLDQIGWPCIHDAQIALRAVDRIGDVPVVLAEPMGTIRDYCGGGAPRAAELQEAADLAFSAWISSTAGGAWETAVQIVERVRPSAAEVCRRLVARVQASPDLLDPGEKTFRAFYHLADAAWCAAEGWPAYHAHRGLPSPAAVQAASAVNIASSLTGLPLATAAVTWAIELAARAPAPDVVEHAEIDRSSRGPRVRILVPASEVAFVEEVAALLRSAGYRVEEKRVRAYPTGDSIVLFSRRALEGCDILLAVCTAAESSAWIARELPVQLELSEPSARPRVTFLLRGGRVRDGGAIGSVDLSGMAAREATAALLGAISGPSRAR